MGKTISAARSNGKTIIPGSWGKPALAAWKLFDPNSANPDSRTASYLPVRQECGYTLSVPAKPNFQVILVTAPGLAVARRLARIALESKTAACVNIVPRIESHYWWQGKIEKSGEVLLIIKTTRSKTGNLKKIILKNHPHETPEFVALPVSSGSRRYLRWLQDSVAPDKETPK